MCRCVCKKDGSGVTETFFLFLAVDQKLHCSKNMATFMGIHIL